jgi:hypothetical protein
MVREPSARFLLLRRATVILTATSVALAGALYLQVSGALAGVGEAIVGSAQPADTGSGGFSQAPQPAPVDPTAGAGQPVARSGGS